MLTWEELEAEYSEMYQRIETNDEGDVTMKKVVEHIKGVEAGSGENVWVNQHAKLLREVISINYCSGKPTSEGNSVHRKRCGACRTG